MNTKIDTKVYSGLVISYFSNSPALYKFKFVRTLIHRAYYLYSSYLSFFLELEFLYNLFRGSSYRDHIFKKNKFLNNISNPQTIYVQVINNTTDCFNISELTLEVLDVSIQIFEAPDVCDEIGSEDGYHNFNLDNYSETILNGINAEINYYETLKL